MDFQIKALTNKGIRQFSKYWSELRSNPDMDWPELNSFDSSLPSRLKLGGKTVQKQHFKTKMDFVKYIEPIINEIPNVAEEKGLWNWLTLFYFDQICPDKKPQSEFYIVLNSDDWRMASKHLLNGPYLLYSTHGDLARAALESPLSKTSYFFEQVVRKKNFVNCEALMGAIDLLYFDETTFSLKKIPNPIKRVESEFYGNKIPAPGTQRRLISWASQMELTYDFYSMTAHDVLDLLPAEFDEFKNKGNPVPNKIPLTAEMLDGGEEFTIELDGIRGACRVDNLGTFSDRFRFKLEEKHPNFSDKENQTKYYLFTEPGVIQWRNNVKSKIYLIQD